MLTLMVLGRINEHENKHVQSVILSVLVADGITHTI